MDIGERYYIPIFKTIFGHGGVFGKLYGGANGTTLFSFFHFLWKVQFFILFILYIFYNFLNHFLTFINYIIREILIVLTVFFFSQFITKAHQCLFLIRCDSSNTNQKIILYLSRIGRSKVDTAYCSLVTLLCCIEKAYRICSNYIICSNISAICRAL